MSERGTRLLEAADAQISELIDLISARGDAGLSLRCTGREKLGDGTVAAVALHAADSHLRIAGFLQAAVQTPSPEPRARQSRHRTPRLLRGRGRHIPPSHGDSGPDQRTAGAGHTTENVELHDLLVRLSAARDSFTHLADLTDEQLDAIPPADSFRFCDGQRTLDQVASSALKHQRHQIDAIKAAGT